MQAFITYLIEFLLLILPLFLILLVLIQRGKGGGLAGAFGGMGGQSAFGTKAGDLFTRITIGVAGVWILLCVIAVGYFGYAANKGYIQLRTTTTEGQSQTGKGATPEAPQPDSSQPGELPAPSAPAE